MTHNPSFNLISITKCTLDIVICVYYRVGPQWAPKMVLVVKDPYFVIESCFHHEMSIGYRVMSVLLSGSQWATNMPPVVIRPIFSRLALLLSLVNCLFRTHAIYNIFAFFFTVYVRLENYAIAVRRLSHFMEIKFLYLTISNQPYIAFTLCNGNSIPGSVLLY